MSYLIAGIGILAMWCSGYDDGRRMAGFVLSLTNQVIWVAYALATAQYGFIIGAVVFGAVCVRNIKRHWRGGGRLA